MDKYTVDLDKVLNDFEYSELTDNFSTNKTYHSQTSSNYASSSKSKSEAKHSITNVFHSLNEYLSTDISPNTIKTQVDNKENDCITSNKYFLQTNTVDKNITNNSIDTDKKLKDLELNVPVNEVVSDTSLHENIGSSSNGIDTLLDLQDDTIINDNNILQTELIEEEINSIENLLDLSIPQENNVPFIASNENLINISNQHFLKVDRSNTEIVECLEQSHTNINENESDSIRSENEESVTEMIKSPPIINIPKYIEASSDLGEVCKQEKVKDSAQVIASGDHLEEEALEIPKEIISFENELDLDDSTLNKYLDELESELQEEEELQNDINSEKENAKSMNILEIKQLEVTSTENKENEIKQDIQESLPKEEISTKVTEEIISERVVAVEENNESDIIDKCDKNDTESVSSIERPNQLELSASALDEIPQREINLIGNPGSTPYNNVYITKELQTTSIQKDQSGQDESETSPSVSPTFSEASTETLTDSTESESEEETKQPNSDTFNKQEIETRSQNSEITPINDTFSTEESCTVTAINPNNSNLTEEENACSMITDRTLQPIDNNTNNIALATQQTPESMVGFWLGKEAPLWIPDSDALSCLHCDAKFTVIKRRHHCRACGLVLCSKCCNLKYKLEYLDAEARVCAKCYAILNMDTNSSSGSEVSQTNSPNRQPNPNNPMEYCSVVPPMQQVGSVAQNPPTVMVPVGVLKRKGSAKGKSNKSVMFCDGIRPGSDLTTLDTDFNYSSQSSGSGNSSKKVVRNTTIANCNVPAIDPLTKSFIPNDPCCLPPTVTIFKSDITYIECMNGENIVETLKCDKLTFALQRNLYVHVKIINMDCCINKKAWCFSTDGLISVGQDEIVYLIELIDGENSLPVDIFHHINNIYNDAVKGTTITEMGLSLHSTSNFLDFKNHAGFLYIRPTFQCLQNIIRPTEPYLIGLLMHRWETPWAKIFSLRLVLRLGAEYRYYPTPIISTRHRDSVFVEVGHTIINILADFRNFSYTLPSIRGLTIHMEDKNTTVTIPENRYDQVMKSLNNSSDHILAFSGNFSTKADSHLVCVQDTQASRENSYTTHAINILNKPRKVTGASFIVFNGALKSTSGLTAKSSIIEDGLMIQIPPENMVTLRESLRNMKKYVIQCGCINAPSDETVHIIWGEPDANFNMGVTSPIDNESLSGVPSIRVHNGKDFVCNSGNRLIRWTEVFILQNTDEQSKAKDSIDISKISESISKATCQALVKYLDLLTSNNFYKIGIRTTLHVENVSYSAGSNNIKLPPIYMKNLDNELIPILHRITSNNLGDSAITLELIFRILNT